MSFLGYEKAANPVQLLPRKVTAISQPVIDIALSVRLFSPAMESG